MPPEVIASLIGEGAEGDEPLSPLAAAEKALSRAAVTLEADGSAQVILDLPSSQLRCGLGSCEVLGAAPKSVGVHSRGEADGSAQVTGAGFLLVRCWVR